ncbi:MAG TPA: MBOAT family protein [Sulfurospirillum arcachonense]|nr:MBOAT family protein [Sulfurospirillum arcachonense]
MLFNSYIFIFMFLPFTFVVYFYLNHKRLTVLSQLFLVFASLFFYTWWNIAYLPLILVSILFNYALGVTLSQKKKSAFSKKSLLFIGIVANLSLLGYFKYADFFIENTNLLLGSSFPLLYLLLPLAISFFTFQQVAYLVDSYRGETKEYDFLNYTLFVTFFPQLIAGPIVHHKEMMPQFAKAKNRIINRYNIAIGLFIFSIGLFKKVVIADSFSIIATQGFDNAEVLNLIEGWITSLSYTFQLYFDFSGYTDMAIGVALLFNIRLPINFNSPYKATSIQDFWRRWHITLSRFLKDYIYIPLGGNRKTEIRTYTNLFTTFLIGGIWHGAGWTFVFWGALHGFALMIHRLWQKAGLKMPIVLAWFVTFNFVNIAWVFFRAKEWEDAIKVLKGMFGFSGVALPNVLASKLAFLQAHGVEFGMFMSHVKGTNITLVHLVLAFVVVLGVKNSAYYLENFKPTKRYAVLSALLFTWGFFSLNKVSEFLYFNF